MALALSRVRRYSSSICSSEPCLAQTTYDFICEY
jgi:hypothetical protein